MAEILIYNKSQYGIFNSPNSYDVGDIVVVMPDGYAWGIMECLNTFYIVRVDAPQAEAIKYEEPLYGPIEPVTGERPVKLKRRYKFDITNSLPVALKAQMLNSPTLLIPTISVSNILDKSIWL